MVLFAGTDIVINTVTYNDTIVKDDKVSSSIDMFEYIFQLYIDSMDIIIAII